MLQITKRSLDCTNQRWDHRCQALPPRTAFIEAGGYSLLVKAAEQGGHRANSVRDIKNQGGYQQRYWDN